jgi:response regulator of citrate/malate metabolism
MTNLLIDLNKELIVYYASSELFDKTMKPFRKLTDKEKVKLFNEEGFNQRMLARKKKLDESFQNQKLNNAFEKVSKGIKTDLLKQVRGEEIANTYAQSLDKISEKIKSIEEAVEWWNEQEDLLKHFFQNLIFGNIEQGLIVEHDNWMSIYDKHLCYERYKSLES